MSTSTEPLNLRPVPSSSKSHASRPIPTSSILSPWDFEYQPSPDGKDVNLLIMFHGLGDTKTPFFALAKQLNLPSTAVLSLQAPDPVPLMDNPSYSWYNIFDRYFNPLPSPDATATIKLLMNLIQVLCSTEVGWDPTDIHLFGWGQGGTTALELGIEIGRKGISVPHPVSRREGDGDEAGNSEVGKRLGSIVSICGTTLSSSSSSSSSPSPPTETRHTEQSQTPTLYFNRLNPKSAVYGKQIKGLEMFFKDLKVVQGSASGSAAGGGEGMVRGQEEWGLIMKFWSQVLKRADEGWKGSGDIYEVVR